MPKKTLTLFRVRVLHIYLGGDYVQSSLAYYWTGENWKVPIMHNFIFGPSIENDVFTVRSVFPNRK